MLSLKIAEKSMDWRLKLFSSIHNTKSIMGTASDILITALLAMAKAGAVMCCTQTGIFFVVFFIT